MQNKRAIAAILAEKAKGQQSPMLNNPLAKPAPTLQVNPLNIPSPATPMNPVAKVPTPGFEAPHPMFQKPSFPAPSGVRFGGLKAKLRTPKF